MRTGLAPARPLLLAACGGDDPLEGVTLESPDE